MTREFAKDMRSLGEIFDFLGDFSREHGLSKEVEFCINLVAEELFTNAVKYGARGSDRVLISIDEDDGRLRLELVDFDAEPFDPTSVEPVTLGGTIQTRKAGGLGLHLVRSLVDDLAYEYRNGTMRVKVTKQLET